MNLRNFSNAGERRKALEEKLSLDLSNIGNFGLDEERASSRDCENMIGAVQIPIGVAGPIGVANKGSEIKSYFVPLATTEGALVASISRGCKAITESGGVTFLSKRVGITRAPVFRVKNIVQGQEVINWMEDNFEEIREVAESTSSHLGLMSIKPWLVGRNLYVRFGFDTTDAMGMNMATIAATEIVKYIEEKKDVHCVAVSGNMCVDKKPNYVNFVEGRGYGVWAEVVLTEEVIRSVLKTERQEIIEVAERKLHAASIMSGMIGSNAQMANVLAAIFLATGQDIAHVAECSTGITTVEDVEGGLYVSIYMPDLVVGTVGGGTELATQREALGIMAGGDNRLTGQEFAERIGGAVLAGEISLLASLAEGSLARVHKRLGRGEK